MGIQRCEEGETPINCVQSTMEPRHELAYEKTLVERVPARRLPGALDQRRCRWRATPPKTWSPTGAHRRPRMRLATCRVEEDGTHRLRLKKGITDMKHTQNLYHWWLLPLLSYLFKPHTHQPVWAQTVNKFPASLFVDELALLTSRHISDAVMQIV